VGRTLRRGLGAGALLAIVAAIVSFAAGASPLVKSPSPSDSISARLSLALKALIYAKDGSRKLVDGRWNLGQSESKLGIQLSADETKQLMACTGQIVCEALGGGRVTASASSVLSPDLLVTAKHVFFDGKRAAVSFGRCSFRSFSRRNVAIPIFVEKDQRKGYVFNNEDFTVLRLKRELEGCSAFAINDSDSSLFEGEQVFSVTGHQRRILNKISRREPVLAKGTIRNAFDGFFGGPPFYHADIDFDVGGSGGAVFALKDGRPVSDDEGRLILRGLLVAYGRQAKNNRPYSEDRNFTIVVGLQAEFRDLVKGKARKPLPVEPATCLQGGPAKIDVIAEDFTPLMQSLTVAPSLRQYACSRESAPNRKAAKTSALCTKLEKELKEFARLKRAASRRVKEKHEFRLKNDKTCPICFAYDRCNGYGCWDEPVRLSGKSMIFAGVREQAPEIKNPQFCESKPALAAIRSPATDAESPPPLPPRKPEQTPTDAASSREHAGGHEDKFMAAKEKAKRVGVQLLTAEDIRGLSLEQIRELRGY
jgi:Trypsin-like peptidase domain